MRNFGSFENELEDTLGVRFWEENGQAHTLWSAALYQEADTIREATDAALELYEIVTGGKDFDRSLWTAASHKSLCAGFNEADPDAIIAWNKRMADLVTMDGIAKAIRDQVPAGSMEYARKCNADLLLATDPDCDRVGIAVKNKAGEYELLTGNQTGMLLLDYICSQRIKHGKMPADPVMIKTIVTMDMGEQIAAHYGLRTVNVLTGFKFIGEQIGKLEQLGKADSYVFGFEESYGYLTGSYVRDKDGVDGAYMICEMFSYYATQGISLLDRLDELYKTYGYCLNTLHSYEFDGSAGFARMQSIMQAFRGGIKEFGGKKVVRLLDYVQGLDGLPKSDVLKFLLEDNCSLVVRPSGTEPKLKIYISVSAENKEMAEEVEDEIAKTAEKWIC